MDQKKKPFHETVAETLIKQLEQGTAPWQKPWEPGASGSLMPFNPTTGNRYRGINALHLLSQDHSDQRWLTYKQSVALGGQVRKGEKGTSIQYWKFTEEQRKKDAQGQPVLDGEGKPMTVTVKLERPRVFYATVFNAEQIDGLPPLQKIEQTWNPLERAESILVASGASILHNGGGRAFYRPSSDSIHLPEKSQFLSSDKFYATALHELGHWTGHQSRLDRDLSHPFGSEGYSREELRAEIASMLLGDSLGIGHDPEQHAAYVGSWINVLQNDHFEIFRAAADAERIQDFVLALEQQQVQERATELGQTMPHNPHEHTLAEDEKAVQRARQEEARIKSDTNSTDEARKAARELRKTAELNATVNSEAFRQKVAEIEQHKLQQSSSDQPVVGLPDQEENKTYLQVPYKEKNQAKELGAKWDRGKQSWYVPATVDFALFAHWLPSNNDTNPLRSEFAPTESPHPDRQFLAVPYTERVVAKAAGARWDKEAKSWYAGDKADMDQLKPWLPEYVTYQQTPAMRPREEFAEALTAVGCIVNGEHPMMDGRTHRIATVGDKSGERAGFYVAYLDGHPAGHIQNNRTGESLKWKAKGYSLNEAEKAQMLATTAAKRQERELAQKAQQNIVASAVRELLAIAPLASPEHPYLQMKQARPGDMRVVPEQWSSLPETSLILIGKDWKESKRLRETNPDNLVFTAGDLLLAAQNIDGEVSSVQSIQSNGLKRFAAGGAKQDTFHVVGGQGLEESPVLILAEGYATADTLSQVLGFATVAAFDSGNLPQVAKLLHEKFPNKPMIIAADNDRHLELTEGRNPGKEKAEAAAKAVNGTLLLPVFAPGEQTYPAHLELVTPTKARRGDLTEEQKQAIAQMKRFTDFNDLATKSLLGKEGVERQVTPIVNSLVLKSQKQQEIQQQHECVDKLEQQLVQRRALRI